MSNNSERQGLGHGGRAGRESEQVTWSACIEGFMFLIMNEGHKGELDLLPLTDERGQVLACLPRERALAGRLPDYRIVGGRLVRSA